MQERVRVVSGTKTLEGGAGEKYGTMLLGDIRTLFVESQWQPLSSKEITERLCEREERPWGDMGGARGLTKHKLANLLRPFGIGPQQIKMNYFNERGYRAEQFADAWARYLEPLPSVTEILNRPFSSIMPQADTAQSATSLYPNQINGFDGNQTATVSEEVAIPGKATY
jgi:hypothetical protein